MTLKEQIQLFRRGLKLWIKLEKRYTICLILENVLDSLTGYIPIYFSAKLIDALASRQPLNVLVLYAALTVGLVFLVKLLRVWIVGIKHTYENVMYHNEDWMFSDKAMQMAYESIENPEVTRLKYRIRRESQTGSICFICCTVLRRWSLKGARLSRRWPSPSRFLFCPLSLPHTSLF